MRKIRDAQFKTHVNVDEERRKTAARRMREEEETPMGQFFQQVRKGAELKKVTRCDYGMVYDPRIKKCIPVEQEVAQVEVERAIDKTIEKIEREKEKEDEEGGDGNCVIM